MIAQRYKGHNQPQVNDSYNKAYLRVRKGSRLLEFSRIFNYI